MKLVAAVLAIGTLLSPAGALAKEWTVTQVDKEFQPSTLTVKVGDTITFVNAETRKRRHTVYTDSAGFQYIRIRKQLPGEKESIVIKNTGSAAIRCALHPGMKLTLSVTR